ncbi:MAG: GspE/PulE family protein [Bifidobacteriaceae bacterium]|nr:GspE/PulE family protein [Bifidobacteriaceae bacterium]
MADASSSGRFPFLKRFAGDDTDQQTGNQQYEYQDAGANQWDETQSGAYGSGNTGNYGNSGNYNAGANAGQGQFQQGYTNGNGQQYGNPQGDQQYGTDQYGNPYMAPMGGGAEGARPRHAQPAANPTDDALARAASAVANARRGGMPPTMRPNPTGMGSNAQRQNGTAQGAGKAQRPQGAGNASGGNAGNDNGNNGTSGNHGTSGDDAAAKAEQQQQKLLSADEKEAQQAQQLARSMSLPYVNLDEYQIDKTVVNIVPGDLCRKNHMLPIDIIKGQLAVATSDPTNFAAIDDISAATGMTVLPMVAAASKVDQSINRYLRANDELKEISDEIVANTRKEVSLDDSQEDAEATSPVARFVSLIISQAIDDHCSDIHIEPQEDGLQVRFRIDGVLHVFQKAPKEMTQGVISRIKVLSDMDIGEHRKPQDGRITVRHNGKNVDLRVAALPTVWGEKIVMRILSTPAGNLKVEDLNFSERNYKVFKAAYTRPYGMVLVTGPTGSGKSTTLYATLGNVARPEINVITVEDPVEFRMKGINQVQVNNKAGMTFAAALRSILRADPDVVLIGEIRDAETAKIATEAALTGHLVLSTLHTNDAPSAVSRLVEMGVEPFLISASLCGVMAQRLARRLCPYCKKEDKATPAELRMLEVPWKEGDELPTVFRPVGCKECSNTGYHGRVAVQQVMGVGDEMESMIAKGCTSLEIQRQAEKDGMTSLRADGWDKVKQGITSVEEIVRVTV